MLKISQCTRWPHLYLFVLILVLIVEPSPVISQSATDTKIRNECVDLSWVRPATLHRLMNSPVLEPLAKTEIDAPLADNRNSFSWCLVGELLQWLRVMKPEDPREYDRAAYRTKVWDALYLMSFNVLEGDTFEPEAITSSLNLKFAGRFSQMKPEPKIQKPTSQNVAVKAGQEKVAGEDVAVSLVLLTKRLAPKPEAEPDQLPATDPTKSNRIDPLGLKAYMRTAELNLELLPRNVTKLPADCRPLSSFKSSTDPDVRKYAREFEAQKICYKVRNIVESGTRWVLQVFENPRLPSGPTWFLPHDDSDTAFDAAVHALKTFGGRVVAVHSNEKRQNGGVDVNQLFGTTKTEVADCAVAKDHPSPQLTVFIYKLFPPDSPVFMINNNGDEGEVTASVSDEWMTGALANSEPVSSDADDFIRLVGRSNLEQENAVSSAINFLQDSGFNVIYQTIPRAGSDCSFANFAALRDRPFFSIEAEHGHLAEQKAMIDKLINILQKI